MIKLINMIHTEIGFISTLGLFFGMLTAIETGRRLGARRLAEDPVKDSTAAGLLDGAVFGLMGLLLAFTFNGAASRFDHRKELAFQEANAIGTAYLRLDLLPVEAQPELRGLFRRYLDARLNVYRKLPDLVAAEAALVETNALQNQIWSKAVKECQSSGSVPATTLLLAALNEMIDIATLRISTARSMHPPIIIFVMLFVLVLMSSFLAGYMMAGSRKLYRIHVVGYAAIIGITTYVIIDLEYPRLGLIRIEAADQVLVDVRKSMD